MERKARKFYSVLIVVACLSGTDLMLGHFLNARDYNSFRTKHYYTHHTLLPYRDCLATWGRRIYHVKTNSLGCRDATTREVNTLMKGPRLMIVGDSHAEGVGIEYKNTAAGIIQDSLSSLGIDVINASVASYSPKLYYLKTRYLIDRKKLHITDLLVMIDISDLQNEIVYEKFKPDTSEIREIIYPVNEFFMKNSFIYRRTYVNIKKYQVRKFIRASKYFFQYARNNENKDILSLYISFFDRFNDDQLVSDPGFHDVQDWFYNDRYRPLLEKGLGLEMENIAKLKDYCDQKNIRLMLSVHPWRKQVQLGDTCDSYVRDWESFCKEKHIDFINLYPAFIHPDLSLLFFDEMFLPEDNHWSEYGNAQVAEVILKRNLQFSKSRAMNP